jgi:hypothetical protein
MKPPSYEYRNWLRGVRMFLTPNEEQLLMGEFINDMQMDDLEALFELVMGGNPRDNAPPTYQPRR